MFPPPAVAEIIHLSVDVLAVAIPEIVQVELPEAIVQVLPETATPFLNRAIASVLLFARFPLSVIATELIVVADGNAAVLFVDELVVAAATTFNLT